MIANLQQITENQTVRTALDWTVFGIGVLSLTIAITATILTHSVEARSDTGTSQATRIVETG